VRDGDSACMTKSWGKAGTPGAAPMRILAMRSCGDSAAAWTFVLWLRGRPRSLGSGEGAVYREP